MKNQTCCKAGRERCGSHGLVAWIPKINGILHIAPKVLYTFLGD